MILSKFVGGFTPEQRLFCLLLDVLESDLLPQKSSDFFGP